MNYQQIIYKSVVIISLLLLNLGCTSGELDFDQTSNFESKPIYKVYFKDFIPVQSFTMLGFTIGNEISLPDQDIKFDNSIFKYDVETAELNFLISNKINSDFKIEIKLLDGTTVLDNITIDVPASNSNFKYVEYYPNRIDIATLKKVNKVSIKVLSYNITASTSELFKMETLLTAYIKP
jgi:hypothetical protein